MNTRFNESSTLEDLRAHESLKSYKADDALALTVTNLDSGSMYSLLAVAKYGDEWASTNRDSTEVVVSKADPMLRPQIKRVVNLEEAKARAQYKSDTLMSFKGKDAKNLEADDWVVGTDQKTGEPILVKLLSKDENEDGKKGEVFWNVKNGALVEVYERLSFQATWDVTRDLANSEELTSQARRLESDIEFQGRETLPLKFSAGVEVAKLSIGYTADIKFQLEYSVEIDFRYVQETAPLCDNVCSSLS